MLTDLESVVLKEFELRFPSEKSCFDFVCQLVANQRGFTCHYCNSAQVERLAERTVRCIECNTESWFLSGTIFERQRKFKAFLGIFWFNQNQCPLSSSRAHQLFHIAQSSAWGMQKKIDLISSADQEEYGTNVRILADAFAEALRKRSRETPARLHPRAELSDFEFNWNGEATSSPREKHSTQEAQSPEAFSNEFAHGDTPDASAVQWRILDIILKHKSPVHIDVLMESTGIPVNDLILQLTYLELESLIKAESSGRYSVNHARVACADGAAKATEPISAQTIQEQIARFLEFCYDKFHGTSRKYLQLYLFRFAQATSKVQTDWDSFMAKMVNRSPVSLADVLSYVSPSRVSLMVA